MSEENSLRNIIGEELLNKIQDSYMKYLETSAAIYEVNGDYATALFTSRYCDFLNQASRRMAGKTDDEALKSCKWICHEDCWFTSLKSIQEKKPCELECAGGIKIYAAPIIANDIVIGSNNAGVSNPPTDEKRIKEIAKRYRVDPKELLNIAREYTPRPEYVFTAAKNHILVAADTIAEIFLRKRSDEDILLHKKREDELRESKELIHQLTENIQEVFWICDPELTEMIYISPRYEHVWGRTCKSLYKDSMSFMEGIHPEDREQVKNAIAKWTEEPYDVQYRVLHPDGSVFWLWARGFPVKDESGQVSRIVGIAEDITKRKKAEEELKERIKELEIFHDATVDRELRMEELRERIKELEGRDDEDK